MNDNRWLKNSIVYLIILVAALALLFNYFNNQSKLQGERGIYQVLADAKAGLIVQIDAQADSSDILVTYKDNPNVKIRSRIEKQDSITRLLLEGGVAPGSLNVIVQPAPAWGGLLNIFTILLPVLLMIGFFIFFMRQAQSQQQTQQNIVQRDDLKQIMSTTTFADVGGLVEAKKSLEDIVFLLQHPDVMHSMGAKIPRGVLLEGPSGTGKTLLAHAVAGEARVPMFARSGTEFAELWVGVGASRMRNLFATAKANSPCVIFIDNLEALGVSENNELQHTFSQLLLEIDALGTAQNIVLVGATSRVEQLDPALLRPGRFDRHISIDLPNERERLEILEIHTRSKPLKNVNLREIARSTEGRTSADLVTIINEAAIRAAKQGSSGRRAEKAILQEDLELAMRSVGYESR